MSKMSVKQVADSMPSVASNKMRNIAEQLRKKGQGGDTVLAHISPEEAMMLGRTSGGDINPHTGLPQYGFFKKIFPFIAAAVGNYFGGPVGAVAAASLAGASQRGKGNKLKGAASGAMKGAGYAAAAPTLGSAFGINPSGMAGQFAGMNSPSLLNQLGMSSAPSFGGGIGLFGNGGAQGIGGNLFGNMMGNGQGGIGSMFGGMFGGQGGQNGQGVQGSNGYMQGYPGGYGGHNGMGSMFGGMGGMPQNMQQPAFGGLMAPGLSSMMSGGSPMFDPLNSLSKFLPNYDKEKSSRRTSVSDRWTAPNDKERRRKRRLEGEEYTRGEF